MFKSVINSTPLTSSAANSFFQNIVGEGFRDDFSFLATLRALVAPRMGNDDKIYLSFTHSSYSVNDVRSNPVRKVLNAICGDVDAVRGIPNGTIRVHDFYSSTQEDNYACLELVKSSFAERYEGWHMIQKVTEFYRKNFYVICFINPEKKSVFVFVDNMDIRRMHYLQCSIFAFLPWYFAPEAGVSEIEMELINSLREKTSTKYEECIARIASQYDFRTQKIRTLLVGFETRYEKVECDKVRSTIQDYIYEIDRLNEQIGEYLRCKADQEVRLLGLQTKIAQNEGDSEIMEYFLCNRKLVLESVTDTEMTFGCMDYLEYFDEDMAKKMIENKRSYVYRPNGRMCNNYIPEDDMKMLMTAIFLDQTIRMKLCAAYRFRLNGSVDALSHYTYGYEFRDCMPNTHIDAYRCMGNYSTTINRLLRDNNYIGALEQCIASCKSLNFADGTVMEEFMRRIYGMSDSNVNTRCIELPDGTVVSPKEAIEWLKAQKKEEMPNE